MAIFSWSRESRRWLALTGLGAAGAVLLCTHPQNWSNPNDADAREMSCLDNLAKISRAFSLYERDYDEHLPRGVDPEDRFNPGEWTSDPNFTDGPFYGKQASTAPYLHQILLPYTHSREVFHCPADVGWATSQVGSTNGGLPNITPSSYARFGTSYYYFTANGLNLMTPADFPDPSRASLLFDGDAWHGPTHSELNCLYADGHTGAVGVREFNAAMGQ